MTLAKEKGRADLADKAQEKVREIEADLAPLLVEERDLRRTIDLLKENLKSVRSEFDWSVDTDQLKANLEVLGGEPDKTADGLRDVEAELELQELKKKMGQGDG